jgi:hypothetical protein
VRYGFDYIGKTADSLDDDVTTAPRGNHEVLATGYDEQGLLIQNSWGTNWGFRGYGRLSWRVVSTDVYQAHTISGFGTTTGDTTRPVISPPDERLVLGTIGGSPSAATVPVDVSWSASDESGIKKYEVYLQQGSGKPGVVALASETATSHRFFLAAGQSYKVHVQAQDGAGNWGAAYATDTFTASVLDDSAWSFRSWKRYADSDAFGGSYLATATAGSWFSYSERASDLGLIALKFDGAGRSRVSHDGKPDGKVNLFSSAAAGRQLVYSAHFADPAQLHTVKLVAGTGWSTIDGIVLLR